MAKENLVYELIGEDGQAYYTFKIPIFIEDHVVCSNLIGKGVVSEDIISKKIEEYYRVELDEEKVKSVKFPLGKGVMIKLLDTQFLLWLNKNEKEAKDSLKDRLLQYYQSALPVLLQNVEVLKKELINLQQSQGNSDDFNNDQRPPRQSKKNNLLI